MADPAPGGPDGPSGPERSPTAGGASGEEEEEPDDAGDGRPEAAARASGADPCRFNWGNGLVPAYPFPADFHLEFQGSRIEAIRHLCPSHPEGTRAVAIFFPGVHGGVGPCRAPGQNFCPDALFPAVSRRLVEMPGVDVDCYRISWPFMRPRVAYSVGGACRILHHALLQAMRNTPPSAPSREVRVLFVGHSLGGAVALQAAEVVARHFGADGEGGQQMEGLERAVVRMGGLCTLNGAFASGQEEREATGSLCGMRALLVVGTGDEVVPPESSHVVMEALPMQDKRLLELEGGTHDLFAYKEQLVDEVTRFIVESAGGDRPRRESAAASAAAPPPRGGRIDAQLD